MRIAWIGLFLAGVFGCQAPEPAIDLTQLGDESAAVLPHAEDADEQQLAGILDTDKPVVLDFYTTWCGPCQKMAPELVKLAGEFENQAVVAKIDCDRMPIATEYFRVTGFPTILVIHNKQIVRREVGYAPNIRFQLSRILKGLVPEKS